MEKLLLTYRGKVLTLFFLFINSLVAFSQEVEKKLLMRGYVKDMVTFTFIQDADSVLIDNLFHNRLNFQWIPNEKLTGKLEIRNRLFTGNLIENNDFFDLALTLRGNDVVFQSIIDRAYLQWNEEKWQLSIGRQRINWGVNLAWNPNDIFNAYSLLDFDYEERQGSDAIRFQRYIGFAGGYEVAIKIAESWNQLTAAGLYKWNYNNYDFQMLGGVMKGNAVVGGAWAGNVWLTGFKGEFTYFNKLNNDEDGFLASITSDYSFPNSLYLNGSFLYNTYYDNSGLETSINSLDVRSISPYKWSSFLQTSYTFHPLINGGFMILVFPGVSDFLVGPSITFSPIINFDLDLLSQIFIINEQPDVYLLYTRLKYSF